MYTNKTANKVVQNLCATFGVDGIKPIYKLANIYMCLDVNSDSSTLKEM